MKIYPIGHLVKTNPIQTQYKPNCLKAKMDVTLYVIKEYERNDIFAVPENKANSNPISKQLHGPQAEDVTGVALLGSDSSVSWEMTENGLQITPPANLSEEDHAWSFRISTIRDIQAERII